MEKEKIPEINLNQEDKEEGEINHEENVDPPDPPSPKETSSPPSSPSGKVQENSPSYVDMIKKRPPKLSQS